jgi:hypothetical protein
MTDTKSIDPKGLIPDAKWRQLMGGISPSTEKRYRKTIPDYPPTITVRNRSFKRVGDASAFLDRVAEQAGGKPQISHGISDADAEVAKAARAGINIGTPKLKALHSRHLTRRDPEPGRSGRSREVARAARAGQAAPERKKITREVPSSRG